MNLDLPRETWLLVLSACYAHKQAHPEDDGAREAHSALWCAYQVESRGQSHRIKVNE